MLKNTVVKSWLVTLTVCYRHLLQGVLVLVMLPWHAAAAVAVPATAACYGVLLLLLPLL